jgi:hypothetical protein
MVVILCEVLVGTGDSQRATPEKGGRGTVDAGEFCFMVVFIEEI